MSNQGLGVLIGYLAGNEETVTAVTSCVNKEIIKAELVSDSLEMTFADGVLHLFDDGQSCCESRYMRTDDDLSEFAGATFIEVELKSAPNIEYEWGEHEVQFLEVKTSKGPFVMSSHNEHNGYYGGFLIRAKFTTK